MYTRNLKNFQLEPSRLQRTIDICISFSNASIISGTLRELCFSDHLPIYADINLDSVCEETLNERIVTVRDHRNFNYENFNTQLDLIDWDDFESKLEVEDIDAANEIFCTELLNVYNYVAPLAVKRKGKHENLPPEIVAWIRERNRLLRQTRRFPDNQLFKDDFRNIRNFVTSLLREYRSKKYQRMTSKLHKDSKVTWKFLNHLVGRIKDKEVCEVTSDELNSYFTEPKPWSVVDRSPCNDCVSDIELCSLKPLLLDDMFKCLARLKSNAAPGLDMITSQQLKLGKHRLIPKLHCLFNRIIFSGIIPTAWKMGKIITIYKGKGDKKRSSKLSTHNTSIVPI